MDYIPEQGKALTKEEIKSIIEKNNVRFIRLQFVDINGKVKNMAVPATQIDKVLNNECMLDGSSIKGFRSIETSDMYFFPGGKTKKKVQMLQELSAIFITRTVLLLKGAPDVT